MRDVQQEDPATTEGLDELFQEGLSVGLPPGVLDVEEGLPEGVPVSDAATILGVTERAVLKRLRRGTLKGFKVAAKRGKKWLVSRDELQDYDEGVLDVEEGLPEEVPVADAGVLSPESHGQSTFISELTSETGYSTGVLIEEEGVPVADAGVPSSGSPDLIDLVNQLQSSLDKANEQLQSACFRNGYLESKLEEREREIKLLTDSQSKSGWWVRFTKWFFGQ